MDQLLNDLDNNEDLEELAHAQKQPDIVAFTRSDEMETKYAVAAPTIEMSRPSSNIFSKKRPIEEISSKQADEVEPVQIESEDVEMAIADETPEQ